VQAHGRRMVKFFCGWLSQDDLSFHKLGKCLKFIHFPVVLQRSSLRTSPWTYFNVGNVFSSGFSPRMLAMLLFVGKGVHEYVCVCVCVCVRISPQVVVLSVYKKHSLTHWERICSKASLILPMKQEPSNVSQIVWA